VVPAERSGSEESSGADGRNKEPDEYPSPKDKDKDEEMVKVFDGNLCMKRRTFRTITISRSANMDQLIAAALRAFHIHDDPRHYVVTDFYGESGTSASARSLMTLITLTT
jgi:hypothetical protein